MNTITIQQVVESITEGRDLPMNQVASIKSTRTKVIVNLVEGGRIEVNINTLKGTLYH